MSDQLSKSSDDDTRGTGDSDSSTSSGAPAVAMELEAETRTARGSRRRNRKNVLVRYHQSGGGGGVAPRSPGDDDDDRHEPGAARRHKSADVGVGAAAPRSSKKRSRAVLEQQDEAARSADSLSSSAEDGADSGDSPSLGSEGEPLDECRGAALPPPLVYGSALTEASKAANTAGFKAARLAAASVAAISYVGTCARERGGLIGDAVNPAVGVGYSGFNGGGGGGGGGDGDGEEEQGDVTLLAGGSRQRAPSRSERLLGEERRHRFDDWLARGIIVKISAKDFAGGRYYRRLATVSNIVERFVAEVRVSDCGHVIRIDQENLETVVPSVDSPVMIVNGRGRGCMARLQRIDLDRLLADIAVVEGIYRGQVFRGMSFGDFSQVDEAHFHGLAEHGISARDQKQAALELEDAAARLEGRCGAALARSAAEGSSETPLA